MTNDKPLGEIPIAACEPSQIATWKGLNSDGGHKDPLTGPHRGDIWEISYVLSKIACTRV